MTDELFSQRLRRAHQEKRIDQAVVVKTLGVSPECRRTTGCSEASATNSADRSAASAQPAFRCSDRDKPENRCERKSYLTCCNHKRFRRFWSIIACSRCSGLSIIAIAPRTVPDPVLGGDWRTGIVASGFGHPYSCHGAYYDFAYSLPRPPFCTRRDVWNGYGWVPAC